MHPSKRPWIPALTLLATAASVGGCVFLFAAAGLPTAASPAGSDALTPASLGGLARSADSRAAQRSELGWRAPEQLRSGLFSVAAGTSLSFDVEHTPASRTTNREGDTLQTRDLELRGGMRAGVLGRGRCSHRRLSSDESGVAIDR
jgi:hypothetical protein